VSARATLRRMSGLHLWILAAVLCAASPAAAWRKVGVDKGVTIYDEPDSDRVVPRFKGVTTIDAPMYQLLAILADMERAPEWNSKLIVSDVLERKSDLDLRFYWRFEAPWPVDDRDGVLQSQVTHDGDALVAAFRTVSGPERPSPDGVTRFGWLRGHFRFTPLGPSRTRVEHLVDADPSGMIPSWLVQFVTKNIPVESLSGLRRQAAKTQGQYDAFIQRNQPPAPASGANTPLVPERP